MSSLPTEGPDERPLPTNALRALALEDRPQARCPACHALNCPGWESLPGSFDRGALERIGTLRDPSIDEPTVAEYHPGGTHAWSADAPIAPAWFPYNRSEVWRCKACARPFLRYTEYGGYYTEERIRELAAPLIVDVPAC